MLGVCMKKLWFFSPVSIIVKEPRFMPLFLHCVCAFISAFYSLFSQLPASLEVSCPVDFQWTVAFPLHDSIKHTLCLSVCCKYSCSSQLRNRNNETMGKMKEDVGTSKRLLSDW